jgi:hypothetical protein
MVFLLFGSQLAGGYGLMAALSRRCSAALFHGLGYSTVVVRTADQTAV